MATTLEKLLANRNSWSQDIKLEFYQGQKDIFRGSSLPLAAPSSSKSKEGFFGTFEGAINRLSAFEKQAMSKERVRKQAANSSAAAAPHAAIPIIEMDSDHSDLAGEAGSHGNRTPSAGHTVGEAWAVDLHVA